MFRLVKISSQSMYNKRNKDNLCKNCFFKEKLWHKLIFHPAGVMSCLLIINKKNIKPAGKVLPSKKVMGLAVFLDIPGTGGCRRRDSLMHIVVYGILLRSSLRTRQETHVSVRCHHLTMIFSK